MTLHDYKFSAPCYSLFRDDSVCELCVGKVLPVDAVKYRCVRGSAVASSLCAVEAVVNRRSYLKHVDRFVVPSRYAADIASRGGVPEDRIAVVPWGVGSRPDHDGADRVPSADSRRFAYVGRLHGNKGIGLLLQAWEKLAPNHQAELFIAGGGEMASAVLEAAARDSSIHYMGVLTSKDVQSLLGETDCLVVPSLVPESMGLSALEGMLAGVPVLLSDRGALGDLMGPGVVAIHQLSPEGLANDLNSLISSADRLRDLRKHLRGRDLSPYKASVMVSGMERVYMQAESTGN
nr:glycosyltransferase [Nocardioides luti]